MSLFGTSGIRAVFDKELLDLAFRVGLAVGRGCANVAVATDTRTSGDAMKHAVISGLLAAGVRCADAGIAPTPTLAYITREFDTGVVLTASHNPPEYNGIKLLNPDGSSFTVAQQQQVEAAVAAGPAVAPWGDIKRSSLYEDAVEHHIKAVLAHFPGEYGLKVVVDAGCGAASEVTPKLLERMGCEVITMNCYPSGFFPRPVEPTEANLKDLKKAVKDNGAALGIAHDGDADRMMAVDDRGEFVPGDKLLAVFAWASGAKEVVTTLDASMAIEEMGCSVVRTPIGDTAVSEELRKGGDFGGETSGSWIFPAISLCPDGIFAAARLVEIAAHHKLSELAANMPGYPLLRGSVNTAGADMAKLEPALLALEPVAVSRTDGLRLSFEDGWVLVRPSGTEPKIRLTAEAKTMAGAKRLYDGALKAVEGIINTEQKTA